MEHKEAAQPYLTPLPDFLEDLRERGVALLLDGDTVRCEAGWRKVEEEERARLRDEILDVMELLADPDEPGEEADAANDDEQEEKAPDKAVLSTNRRRRPDPGEFTPGRGHEYWWKKHGQHIPEEEMTEREIIAGRKAFARRFNYTFRAREY